MTEKQPKLELIPWDYAAKEHVERMYLQRLGCGWRSDEVEQWARLGRDGTKTLYWVVLRDDFVDRENIIARHIASNLEEPVPIHDTAQSHWLKARIPTGRLIHPIGHIALDLRPEQNFSLKFTEAGIIWIAGLYISYALQASGFGRETMQLAETIASQPPLNGKWIVLDTMSREQQMTSEFAKELHHLQGRPVPVRCTQDWYERQGYAVFMVEKGGYKWVSPATGVTEDIDFVFMRKKTHGS